MQSDETLTFKLQWEVVFMRIKGEHLRTKVALLKSKRRKVEKSVHFKWRP